MCGIVGCISFSEKSSFLLNNIEEATSTLVQRGPDHQKVKRFKQSALGHARLAVIDTSDAAVQPFSSEDGRYHLVYNGEIYNYKELRDELIQDGVQFRTSSDTEVLLYILIKEGDRALSRLNGFFAFCFYDKELDIHLLARDRFGIKPLVISEGDDYFAFASEMKALLKLGIERELDKLSSALYCKFNYLPKETSILTNCRRLAPGSYLQLEKGKKGKEERYYSIPNLKKTSYSKDSYEQAKEKVRSLLRKSVERRLVADVPLGCFLSGGIDSSIITALASELKSDLNTFSIGFQDEPIFDETHYAELVAKKYKTNHTVFKLSNDDLLNELDHFLDYNCEPFADSSALAVNLLCKETRKGMTVALSGDGADELFSGYNKHAAELALRTNRNKAKLFGLSKGVWDLFPKSRNSAIGNVNRQLAKLARGGAMSTEERYWDWAGLMQDKAVAELFKEEMGGWDAYKYSAIQDMRSSADFNEYLKKDMEWVLPGDMLRKVDTFSMANSLEVRVPFLDHELVDYVFSLPAEYKIQKGMKKRLLQDAFRDYLPEELYKRPKHGFEVPLLKWFQGPLWERINGEYLKDDFIKDQGLFNPTAINNIKKQLKSKDPNEAVANTWALVVFQHWYKKYYTA